MLNVTRALFCEKVAKSDSEKHKSWGRSICQNAVKLNKQKKEPNQEYSNRFFECETNQQLDKNWLDFRKDRRRAAREQIWKIA